MPLVEIPQPAPWLSWLPNEFSDIQGVKDLWRDGLRANAGSTLLDASSVLADLWGVDLISEAEGLLDALEAPVAAWIDDIATTALGALGLGASAIPIAGWIVSGLAAVAAAIVQALKGRREPRPSPIEWSPPVYRQGVDQDAVRVLLGLGRESDWQQAMAAPELYAASPAPSPTDPTKPFGGDILPVHGGVLQPGGLADWGWYGWRPPPSGGSTRPGAWTGGDIVTVRGPSVRATQRELWAALLGDMGIVWAVNAVQLREDWQRAGGLLVTSALANAEKLGLIGPYLARESGPFMLADDADDKVREAWAGAPCLIETLPSGVPFPESVSPWKGGPSAHVRLCNLAGYSDAHRRHSWIPRTAAQAVVALDALAARQNQLTGSKAAAWALPTQPGAAASWAAIIETRKAILSVPHSIEADRIRDTEFRLAVDQARQQKPLDGAPPPLPEGLKVATFDPEGGALPSNDPPLSGGGGAGVLLLAGAALAALRSRR